MTTSCQGRGPYTLVVSDPDWYRFVYRDFYDLPRMIVVSLPTGRILLDCQFDPALDDYPDRYQVYRLPATVDADAADWTSLLVGAELLGSVSVGEIEFDPSRRASLHSISLASLLGLD